MESLVEDSQKLVQKVLRIQQEIEEREKEALRRVGEAQAELEEERRLFELEKVEWQSLKEKVRANMGDFNERVKLNVGGTKFESLKKTLMVEGSYFQAMLGSEWQPSSKSGYFIDRDPVYFARVLAFLRTNNLNISGLSQEDIIGLQEEFDYFQIPAPFCDNYEPPLDPNHVTTPDSNNNPTLPSSTAAVTTDDSGNPSDPSNSSNAQNSGSYHSGTACNSCDPGSTSNSINPAISSTSATHVAMDNLDNTLSSNPGTEKPASSGCSTSDERPKGFGSCASTEECPRDKENPKSFENNSAECQKDCQKSSFCYYNDRKDETPSSMYISSIETNDMDNSTGTIYIPRSSQPTSPVSSHKTTTTDSGKKSRPQDCTLDVTAGGPIDETMTPFWILERYLPAATKSSPTSYASPSSWTQRTPCYSRTEGVCPWVIIDIGFPIFPTKYKFGHARQTTEFLMRNWALEASTDEKNWIRLKEHTNDQTLKNPYQVAEWELGPARIAFRYFKVTSLTYIHMYHFDIYGKRK
eukprot:TRINITY_DN7792_c0_g1_i1.p1 TRINITY_DN7792_c0_g1~~TRINITY_DN7792_c0_g1_i1.p1  ORF type:complete len:524 (-),score=86.37 TRINITY_DN7792_c0_g1_i1:64-1635(-)